MKIEVETALREIEGDGSECAFCRDEIYFGQVAILHRVRFDNLATWTGWEHAGSSLCQSCADLARDKGLKDV